MSPGTAIGEHGGVSLVLGPTSTPEHIEPRPNRTVVLCFDDQGAPFFYAAPTDLLAKGRVVWRPDR